MDIWPLVVGMVVGGALMGVGVLLGAAAALGSRNKEPEDIDIP